jgi:hypothetical protein
MDHRGAATRGSRPSDRICRSVLELSGEDGARINDATTLCDICPSTTRDDNSERLEPNGISFDEEVMATRWRQPWDGDVTRRLSG